jgi:hypothetical protein
MEYVVFCGTWDVKRAPLKALIPPSETPKPDQLRYYVRPDSATVKIVVEPPAKVHHWYFVGRSIQYSIISGIRVKACMDALYGCP